MDSEILYHGSTVVVKAPVCAFGRRNLDFGNGFYLTRHREQAERWAIRLARTEVSVEPILNIYEFDREAYLAKGRSCIFKAYDEEWLNFIVNNRSGGQQWLNYDLIEGGVANDRVIDTVNLYITGFIDFKTALGQLSLHSPNNQICLLNQELVNKYLKHIGYEVIRTAE